jgi:hypothetical protein
MIQLTAQGDRNAMAASTTPATEIDMAEIEVRPPTPAKVLDAVSRHRPQLKPAPNFSAFATQSSISSTELQLLRGSGGRIMFEQMSRDVQSKITEIRETHAPGSAVGESSCDQLVSYG